MKLPTSFTMRDRESGTRVKVTAAGSDMYDIEYPSGTDEYPTDYVSFLLREYYDIVEDATTYADQFSFFHADTSQQFDMTKLPFVGTANYPLWACTRPDMAYATGATYTAEEIAGHFEAGDWREVSFSEPVEAERELVFPFTVRTLSDHYYYITERSHDGVTMTHRDTGEAYQHANKADAKRFIRDNLWTVTSVGTQEAVEASPEPSNDLAALSIKIDSDDVVEASERLERLAQAIEDVNISLESFQAIFADVQDMISSNRGMEMRTFCCEEA